MRIGERRRGGEEGRGGGEGRGGEEGERRETVITVYSVCNHFTCPVANSTKRLSR